MSVDAAIARISAIQARVAALTPAAATQAPAATSTASTQGTGTFDQALQTSLATGAGAPAGTAGTGAATGGAGGPYGLGEASPYDAQILQVAQETGVPAALIKAVARAESDFDPTCTSSAGAQGLMQLMPANQEEQGVTDPFDAMQSLRGGAKELKGYLDRFDGNLELVLAAYNAGAGAVQRYGGIPPYAETQAYVPKVLGFLQEYGGIGAGAMAAGGAAPATGATGIPPGYALVPLSSLGLGATTAAAGATALVPAAAAGASGTAGYGATVSGALPGLATSGAATASGIPAAYASLAATGGTSWPALLAGLEA